MRKQRRRSASRYPRSCVIRAFVFTTRIVRFLYFLKPKFPGSNISSVTVQPGLCRTWSKTTLLVFPRGGSNVVYLTVTFARIFMYLLFGDRVVASQIWSSVMHQSFVPPPPPTHTHLALCTPQVILLRCGENTKVNPHSIPQLFPPSSQRRQVTNEWCMSLSGNLWLFLSIRFVLHMMV